MIQKYQVQALLMGGQACVFYGAAQFSKDIDFAIYADDSNYERLHQALSELRAERIAVPRFDPGILERGHAIHYRCHAPGVEGLRVDVMTRMRGVPDFETLWNRRTTLTDESGTHYDLMAIEDLVRAKKTQREKDWPMITALVEVHYRALQQQATPERISFWLRESRTPERLIDLCQRYPSQAAALESQRPLLALTRTPDMDALRVALDAEVSAEKALDRAYWEPLRQELEQFRREERMS